MNKMLKTGYKEVDDEHRELEGIQKKVIQAIKTKDHTKVRTAFDNYVQHTTDHFTHEEEIMDQYAIESLSSHKKLHEDYLDLLDLSSEKIHVDMKFGDFKKEFKNAYNAMIRHIVNYDVPVFEIIKTRFSLVKQ